MCELPHLSEGHVAPISERSDDEASILAHVLIAIAELPCALLDDAVICALVPVEPQLRLPCKLLFDQKPNKQQQYQLRLPRGDTLLALLGGAYVVYMQPQ